jgi:hypothetical protein
MSGSAVGGLRGAAVRLGLDPLVYAKRIAAGKKWCWLDRAWHPKKAFGTDRHRSDGLNANCRAALNCRAKDRYASRLALDNSVRAALEEHVYDESR